MPQQPKSVTQWRFICLTSIIILATLGIVARIIDVSVFKRDFLLQQGDVRSLRVVNIPAHRGIITSANNTPLAISTSVESIWINPQQYADTEKNNQALAAIFNMSSSQISQRLKRYKNREFMYLRRHINPDIADQARALNINGIHFQQETRRFYPEGEVDAQLIGFTNIDDKGQEGIELAYNNWLRGRAGSKEVLKDRLGHVIANIDEIKPPKPGLNLQLALNQAIQYRAYYALLNAVTRYHAASGSVVVIDTQKHDVLAMANVPSYNPNNRPITHDGRYRNRALTDMFEPGSSIKPIMLTYALESGEYTPQTIINTNPGWMVIDGYTIQDTSDHGVITLTQLLQKSSNIGAAKVILSLDGDGYRQLLSGFGFGHRSSSGFPGESPGRLPYYNKWHSIDLATLAFGYGLSVTPMQLANAFSIIADHGIAYKNSLLAQNQEKIANNPGQQIVPAKIASTVLKMMQTVVEKGGTGTRAAIPGYHIAGKTGTSHITSKRGGYASDRYIASFVGIAPATNPRLVVVVVINDPKPDYYGGKVAAPVFKDVMGYALRRLNIAPDDAAALLNKT